MLHKFHSVPEENILYDLNKIELKVALSQQAEILIILTPPHVSGRLGVLNQLHKDYILEV